MNAKWWLILDIHKDNLLFVLALLSSFFPPMKLFPNNSFKMGVLRKSAFMLQASKQDRLFSD